MAQGEILTYPGGRQQVILPSEEIVSNPLNLYPTAFDAVEPVNPIEADWQAIQNIPITERQAFNDYLDGGPMPTFSQPKVSPITKGATVGALSRMVMNPVGLGLAAMLYSPKAEGSISSEPGFIPEPEPEPTWFPPTTSSGIGGDVDEQDYRAQVYEALSGMQTGNKELAELEEMGSTTPGIRRNLVNWVTGKVEDIGDLPFVPQLIDRDQFLPQTPGMFEPTEEDWTWNDPRLARTLVAHKAFQAGDRMLNAALGKIGIDRTKVHRAENTKIAEDLGRSKFGRPLSNSEMDALLHIAGGTTPIAKNVMGLYSALDKDDPLSALQDAINDMVVSSGVNEGKTIEELFDDPNIITGGEDNLQWSDIRNLGRSMSLDVPMEFEGKQLEPQYPYMGTDVSNVRLNKPVERIVPEPPQDQEPEKPQAAKPKPAKTQSQTTAARRKSTATKAKVNKIAKETKVPKSAASEALSRSRGDANKAIMIAPVIHHFTEKKKKDPTVYVPSIRIGPTGQWIGGL
jgi:NACalpha-BTF3-like transcription factor